MPTGDVGTATVSDKTLPAGAAAYGGFADHCPPDHPDPRDRPYIQPAAMGQLPPGVDLRPLCPPVYSQGALGSCTANALAAAIEYNQMRTGQTTFVPSRLFIYYNERSLQGQTEQDAGARIRNGIKTVVRQGAPPEELWPYLPAAIYSEPHPEVYAAAKLNLVTRYSRVPRDLSVMQACLVEGFPIVFRCLCFTSMEDVGPDGLIPMPKPGERTTKTHCMLIVGYGNAGKTFLVRNSWGPMWGIEGYGKMPYAYILSTKLTSDFWTIRAFREVVAALEGTVVRPA
jgi:C1A family cysteine protease